MANASRDQNSVPTLLGVSSSDGITPTTVYADPSTHRLLVNVAGGGGTVTTVSVVTANGFAGSVATATTTPAITLTTSITGILSGNGTAISAASTTGSGAVVLTTNPTIVKPVLNATNPTAQTYTPSIAGTATLDLALANQHYVTFPAGNITLAVSNATNNQVFLVSLTQDSGGSRTVTWFSGITWAAGSPPTLTTTANATDYFTFIRTGSGAYAGFTTTGSGGATVYYPQRATLWADEALQTAGSGGYIGFGTAGGTYLYSLVNYGSGAVGNGDKRSWSCTLAAGNYNAYALTDKNTDNGIFDLAINSSVIGTFDNYAGSETKNTVQGPYSFTVSTAGRLLVNLTANGKNGSSTNYYCYLTKVFIVPTTDTQNP